MALCTLSGCKCENSTISADSLLDFVDPLIGTGGHGHTFPGAAYPFGMVQLSPDTGLEGWDWCSGYHYSDSSIIGFSHTHLSGTGRSDLMDVMLMPVTGNLKLSPGSKSKPDEGYRSRFSHDEESASPGYYKVRLKDYDIMAELTVSPRCGFHRYTFPESESSHIILDLSHHFATDSVLFTSINKIDSCTIIGERKTKGWGEPVEKYWSEQQLFFALKVSKVFDLSIAADEQFIQEKQASGKNIKAILNFETSLNEMVLVKVGISAVSAENALQNLSEEIPHWDFNKTRSETQYLRFHRYRIHCCSGTGRSCLPRPSVCWCSNCNTALKGRKDNGNRSKQGYRPLSGISCDWTGSRVCAGGSGCGCL